MSWFFAAYTKNFSPSQVEKFSSIHSKSLHSIHTSIFYFACGGIKETCHFFSSNENSEKGFCVVGTGLKRKSSSCSIITADEWQQILFSKNAETQLRTLDGHFAIIVLEKDIAKCYTDQLGLRTIYFSKIEKRTTTYPFFFSTLSAWLWTTTKTKLGLSFFDSSKNLYRNFTTANWNLQML
ncbi:MAG: hypothetical protein FJ218_08015 [Ignavibacteria bacterium]|nr:hypothetical protein [Ignavibacteria bacterium]